MYREKNIYTQKIEESTGKGTTQLSEPHLILILLSSHLLFQSFL